MDVARAYAVGRIVAAVALVAVVIGIVLAYRSGPFWLMSLLICSVPLLAACAIYLRPTRQQSRLAAYRALRRGRR